MARTKTTKRPVESYEHRDSQRVNNPPAGRTSFSHVEPLPCRRLHADADHDGGSLYPSQVFFPMADAKSGWAKLAKNLRAEIDEDRVEVYRGTRSLPLEADETARIAVEIVDDRGVESLRMMGVPQRAMGQ